MTSSTPTVWEALPGSQQAALACRLDTFELLIAGSRGTGKSELLLIDFANDVGRGHPRWRGLILRPSFRQLQDLILKSQELFRRAFPGARFVSSPYPVWTFPGGERLEFHQMRSLDDYWKIHGHNADWLGVDELTVYPTPEVYLRCMTIIRGDENDGVPRRVRAATNPGGPGHGWVKDRFGLPLPRFRQVLGPKIQPPGEHSRRVVCGYLSENPYLGDDYIATLRSSCSSAAQLKAWLDGDWNISEGSMFGDLWATQHHVVPDVPFHMIPQGWRLSRSFDWGAASPFSVGWWATSNGEPIEIDGRTIGAVPGDRIRIAEWYGAARGERNKGLNLLNSEIAQGIRSRENAMGLEGRVRPGTADSAIFAKANGTGISIGEDMARHGVEWVPSEKGPNSRVQGWQQFRAYLKGALPDENGMREAKGLFVCERCRDFIRLIPEAPRSEKNPDDLDTDWEDHIADEARYELFEKPRVVSAGTWRR